MKEMRNPAALGNKPLPRAKHSQSESGLRSGSRPTNHRTVLNGLERINQR